MMYKVAKYHIKNHHLAEEAVQNAFIGVARNIDRIKNFDKEYLEIYLCKSAKHAAFSVIKKENIVSSNTVSLDDQFTDVQSGEVLSEAFLQNELLDSVIKYIRSMKSEYSDVLTYHFLYELTLKECSIVLQIPISTVKTRLYKGQKMIQEKFNEYINDRSRN